MFNVMKAQIYQLKRENSTYYIFISGIVIILLFTCIMYASGDISSTELTHGSCWIYNISDTATLLIPFLVMMFTSQVCASDMDDKTLNYEMLTGTSRVKIFVGRSVVSIFMSLLANFLLIILPMPIIGKVCGWGHFMSVREAALRMAFLIFPVIKLSALYSMLAFILSDKKLTILLGFIILILQMIFGMLAEEFIDADKLELILSSLSMNYYLNMENIGMGYFNGEDVMVLKSFIDLSRAWKISAACLGEAVLFLVVGAAVFRRKDMD